MSVFPVSASIAIVNVLEAVVFSPSLLSSVAAVVVSVPDAAACDFASSSESTLPQPVIMETATAQYPVVLCNGCFQDVYKRQDEGDFDTD